MIDENQLLELEPCRVPVDPPSFGASRDFITYCLAEHRALFRMVRLAEVMELPIVGSQEHEAVFCHIDGRFVLSVPERFTNPADTGDYEHVYHMIAENLGEWLRNDAQSQSVEELLVQLQRYPGVRAVTGEIRSMRIYCLPYQYVSEIDYLPDHLAFYVADSIESTIWITAETLAALVERVPDIAFHVLDSRPVLPVYLGDSQYLEGWQGEVWAKAIALYLDIWRWGEVGELRGIAYWGQNIDDRLWYNGIHAFFVDIDEKRHFWIAVCSQKDIDLLWSRYAGDDRFLIWLKTLEG